VLNNITGAACIFQSLSLCGTWRNYNLDAASLQFRSMTCMVKCIFIHMHGFNDFSEEITVSSSSVL